MPSSFKLVSLKRRGDVARRLTEEIKSPIRIGNIEGYTLQIKARYNTITIQTTLQVCPIGDVVDSRRIGRFQIPDGSYGVTINGHWLPLRFWPAMYGRVNTLQGFCHE